MTLPVDAMIEPLQTPMPLKILQWHCVNTVINSICTVTPQAECPSAREQFIGDSFFQRKRWVCSSLEDNGRICTQLSEARPSTQIEKIKTTYFMLPYKRILTVLEAFIPLH